MRVIWGSRELENFLVKAAEVNPNYPVTISKFREDAKEIEVDGVSDGETTVIGAIMEHVQKAGVHSGDAIMTIPTVSVSEAAKAKIRDYTRAIAKELGVKGPFNIQYLCVKDDVEVIECNLRASRSLPFVSKATGANLIKLAADVILGGSLRGDGGRPRAQAVRGQGASVLVHADGGRGAHGRGRDALHGRGGVLREDPRRGDEQGADSRGPQDPLQGGDGDILADEKSELGEAKALVEGFKKAGIDFVTTESLADALGDMAKVASLDAMLDMTSKGKVAMVSL